LGNLASFIFNFSRIEPTLYLPEFGNTKNFYPEETEFIFLKNDDTASSPLNSFREAKSKKVSNVIQFLPALPIFHPLVLIVEDDADTRLMLKYLLEIWSYRVIEAETGEAAVEKAASQRPDAILMDYKLPDIDGLTTTERIRELSIHADTAIIFISAYPEEKVRASVLAAGADDYLVKPIDFGELEVSLEKHLTNKMSRHRLLTKTI